MCARVARDVELLTRLASRAQSFAPPSLPFAHLHRPVREYQLDVCTVGIAIPPWDGERTDSSVQRVLSPLQTRRAMQPSPRHSRCGRPTAVHPQKQPKNTPTTAWQTSNVSVDARAAAAVSECSCRQRLGSSDSLFASSVLFPAPSPSSSADLVRNASTLHR
jgi:hypothetical protein